MKHNFIIIIFSVIIFTSCKTEKTELTGSISGNVKIFAEDGYYMPDATAKVSVLNTDFSAETGTDGFYRINDIPLGTYNMSYSSNGFVDYTHRGVNINGGEKPYLLNDIVLGQKPISVINDLRTYTWGFGSRRIAGDISPPGTENIRKKVVIYVDDKNTVSKDNYYSYEFITIAADTFYVDYINLFFNLPPEADTVFFVAYTKSFDPQDYRYNYNFNCDEYYMNCEDFMISDTPSNIISIPINK